MGAITGVLGLGGGASGSGFSSPQAANLQLPTTVDQANAAYSGTQGALQGQQAFLNALQAQNGIGNQASVFNQLQGVANGTGPNPAQAMLAQATGANTANQAALMAGQRGAGQNAGLIARQAAMQGAANQQNAAGQGASMQAQQSLGALNQLSGIAGQQVGQQAAATGAVTGAQQAEQQNILNSINAQNQAQVGSQSSVNAANAGLAQTTMQGQQGLIGGALNALGTALAEGGEVTRQRYVDGGPVASYDPNNNDNVFPETNSTSSVPAVTINTSQAPAQPTAPNQPSKFASFLNSALSKGTAVPSSAGPNYGNPGANKLAQGMTNALQGIFSSTPANPVATQSQQTTSDNSSPQDRNMMPTDDSGQMMAAKGGKVPALVSPGEQYLKPKDVKKVAEDGKNPLSLGERIPGIPKHPGNDYRNDVVPKSLESGGIVIPNKIMQSKNAGKEARAFVEAILAKKGGLPKKDKK